MSILDVTEDQIFHTLGKGKDPNFKQIEKVRPVIVKPKKTYTINQPQKSAQAVKITMPVEPVIEPVKPIPQVQYDDSIRKISEDICALNSRVDGLQKMVKLYIMPQFIAVLVLLIILVVKIS